MTLTEKVAYLKGLMEGMKFDTDTNEGKILSSVVDILGEMAEEITCTQEDVDTLNDYIEEIDADLGEVEEYLCDEEDECGCGCCDDDDEYEYCDCDECNGDDDEDYDFEYYDDEDEEDDDEDDSDFTEIVCPGCGDTIYIDSSLDGKTIQCPNCGESIPAPEAE